MLSIDVLCLFLKTKADWYMYVQNYPLSIWLGFLNSKVYQTHQMAKKLALSGSIYYDRPEKKSRLFCLALLECIVLYSLLHDWFSKLGYTEINGKLFCCEKYCAMNYDIIIAHWYFLSWQILTDICHHRLTNCVCYSLWKGTC